MTRYTYAKAAYDELQLQAEVAASLPVDCVLGANGSVSVVFAADLTAPQKASLDGVVAAHTPNPLGQTLRTRAAAKSLSQLADALPAALRAVLLVAVDEINLLRARLRAQDAAVAAATTLADLKTRWAVLANVPDRTAAQAKQAILDKLDSGGAD